VVRYDLSALQHNLRQYQQSLAPTTQILAMVKAQAYGGGLDQIAKQLLAGGVNYFGVAYADEGVLLRQAGIKLPILVMNAEPAGFESCIAYQLEPAIYSPTHLDAFIRTLIASQIQDYPIHLKFDTSMHRLGFLPEQTDQLLQTLRAQPEVCVKSVYSHMACADEPQHPMNAQQISSFNAICSQFESALPYPFLKHLLNSEGAAHFPQAQFDMVRLGIGLFGVNHDPQFEQKLKPVISWTSRISQLKQLKKGACVGYGCSEILEADSQIAVIPVGYADGFKRNLSNGRGGVYIDGNFCPTIGRVCMDMIMVLAPNARPDAEVEIIGTQQALSLFAEKAQTIPYEILTSISPRVQRTYVND
jgi:alanine racemase